MNNVSFDDKIYLYEKHIKQETGSVAFVLFCEKSLKSLPTFNFRHKLVLKTGNYHNEGFYENIVTFMGIVFKYKSHVNDLPNLHCDRFPSDSVVYKYNIEIFFEFVCFENELGKFERELNEKKIFDS